MEKGKINVQTENIFPIIKKFLYSDHEIFLRELVSNAVDATTKLKALASMGEFKGDIGETKIEILLDKDKKTLTVRDHGIGMTAEEVEKYINQIAFSSAEEYLEKFKNVSDNSSIIGHFGLGFYSAFMVSDKVEIYSLSYKDNSEAIHWECDGTPNYTIEPWIKAERGTDIVLHINEESAEFLEEQRILSLLKKYCSFLPVQIEFGKEKVYEKIEGEKDEKGNDKYDYVEKVRIINDTNPAWTRKPSDLTDEDYKEFYHKICPATLEEPLFQIHLNVDYPFTLTGILYFPKIKERIEVQREKIQLYSNQVFVTDSVEGIVPEFLTLLHGVIDSPDIPLNVSRSYLQSDSNVKKISNHIMKKVSDKLEELFKKDREDFATKLDGLKVLVQYGMLSEPKFYERAEKFFLLKNIDGQHFTFEEYKKHIEEKQTNKDKRLVYLYSTDPIGQHQYIEAARAKGYDVLEMTTPIDMHFVNFLEQKMQECAFTRVDADIIDKLIEKDDAVKLTLDDTQKEKLKTLFEKDLDNKSFAIVFEDLGKDGMPALITQPEFFRRMKDMQQMGGGNQFGMMGGMPDMYNITINVAHPLIEKILASDAADENVATCKYVKDIAMLSQNMLKGKALEEFIRDNVSRLIK